MEKRKALITGITGQDGSHLADFLLEKGYEVHGMVRRSSTFNRERIDHLFDIDSYASEKKRVPIKLYYGDLTSSSAIERVIGEVKPDEIYHLGAQSHVRVSFDEAEYTGDVVGQGTLRILEAVRKLCPETRFYQASSSEMFGKVEEVPQNEKTRFNPRSPYACAKVYAFYNVVSYRNVYSLYASNGILFNHEGERRGEAFVTRKITRSLSRIKYGLQHKLSLGNLDAERDWGYAKEYVKAMWLMLQQDEPDDYVIGTGEKHSVREFFEECARYTGLKIYSNNKRGLEEKYFDENGKVIVDINRKYLRPADVTLLLADASKAKRKLGWEPKVRFNDLIKIMMDHDLNKAEEEAYVKNRK